MITFERKVGRLVQRASGPVQHQFFDSPDDALAALKPILDAAEWERARQFLAGE